MSATVAIALQTNMARTTSQTRSVLPRRSPGRSCAFSRIRESFLRPVVLGPSVCSSSRAPVAPSRQRTTASKAGLACAASTSSVTGSAASSRCLASPVRSLRSAATVALYVVRCSASALWMTRKTPSYTRWKSTLPAEIAASHSLTSGARSARPVFSAILSASERASAATLARTSVFSVSALPLRSASTSACSHGASAVAASLTSGSCASGVNVRSASGSAALACAPCDSSFAASARSRTGRSAASARSCSGRSASGTGGASATRPPEVEACALSLRRWFSAVSEAT